MLIQRVVSILLKGIPGTGETLWNCLATTLPGALALMSLLNPWTPIEPRKALKAVLARGRPLHYNCYYGPETTLPDKCFMAILEPSGWSENALARLSGDGVIAIGYCSLGEADPELAGKLTEREGQSWKLDLDGDGKGDLNGNWGSVFSEPRSQVWTDHILKRAREITGQGFKGLFLDTLDTCDLDPQLPSAMVQLLRKIREELPEAILVCNRGFSLFRADPSLLTDHLVDGVMFECFSTVHDFSLGKVRQLTRQEMLFNHEVFTTQLKGFKESGGLILSLDYADPKTSEPAQSRNRNFMTSLALSRARDYGFIPLVTTVGLDSPASFTAPVSAELIRKYGRGSFLAPSQESEKGN